MCIIYTLGKALNTINPRRLIRKAANITPMCRTGFAEHLIGYRSKILYNLGHDLLY